MGNEPVMHGMWEYFTLERAEVKNILADASREEGIQGQWQQESPFREVLVQVKGNADMDCGPQMMRRGYLAMKTGGWEELKDRYRKEGKSSEWTLERIREACEKVVMDETDFLRRVIAPVGGERRSIATGGVRCVEANTNGECPTGYWWRSSVPMPTKQRCSKRTRRHNGYVKI